MSQRSGVVEILKGLAGVYPLRCRRCRNRWLTSVWAEGGWKYARCPRCYRQELTTWSEQYYHPPRWTVALLRSGATPYRCPACRCNFASFRPCKERFTWRHEYKAEQPQAAPRPVREVKPLESPAATVQVRVPVPVVAAPPEPIAPAGATVASPAVRQYQEPEEDESEPFL